MSFERIRNRFPEWSPACPSEWRPATREQLDGLQEECGALFPPSFVEFQTVEAKRTPMGDRAWDGFGFSSPDAAPHQRLSEVVRTARSYGVKPFLLPFHYEEGTFWCFDTRRSRPDGEYPVVRCDHMESRHPDGIIDGNHARYVDFMSWLEATFDDL